MAEETAGTTGPLDGQLLQHLAWLTSLGPAFLAVHAGADHVIRYANPAFRELTGHRPLLGRGVREAFPELAGQGYCELLDQVHQTARPFRADALPLHLAPAAGAQPRYLELTLHPLTDSEDAVCAVLVHGLDVTGRVHSQQRVEARFERQARQLEVVALLGQRALDGMRPAHLVQHALAELAEAVGAATATVWQLLPDRDTLRLRHSHGVAAQEAAAEVVRVAEDNAVSRTLREARTVLVDNCEAVGDLAPPLCDCTDARSSASVLVQGSDAPWGVLSVASPNARRFDTEAALFIQRVADLLGQALQRQESDAAAAPARGAGTVLLVEDEPVVRALTAQLLRRGGYAVLEAGRAEEAIALAARHSGDIDLLLADLDLPRGEGREIAARLHRTHPGVPALYLCGYTADGAATPDGAGADVACLHKPFTAAELLGRAHDAIRGRAPAELP